MKIIASMFVLLVGICSFSENSHANSDFSWSLNTIKQSILGLFDLTNTYGDNIPAFLIAEIKPEFYRSEAMRVEEVASKPILRSDSSICGDRSSLCGFIKNYPTSQDEALDLTIAEHGYQYGQVKCALDEDYNSSNRCEITNESISGSIGTVHIVPATCMPSQHIAPEYRAAAEFYSLAISSPGSILPEMLNAKMLANFRFTTGEKKENVTAALKAMAYFMKEFAYRPVAQEYKKNINNLFEYLQVPKSGSTKDFEKLLLMAGKKAIKKAGENLIKSGVEDTPELVAYVLETQMEEIDKLHAVSARVGMNNTYRNGCRISAHKPF